MNVPFNTTPSNLRVPLFYAELDPSHANTAPQAQRTLLIGQMLGAGNYTANLPIQVPSPAAAIAGAGFGSILAAMAAMYMLNDPAGQVYALPIADAGGATAATGTITITGPATASGTLAFYVAGVLIPVAVSAADTATTIATNIAAAINASTGQAVSTMAPCGLPVTAASAAGVVTLTARNGGLAGNDIDVRINYRGSAQGEVTPAGVAVAIVAMSGGATNPTITTALAALGDAPFDFIVVANTDSATLNALQAFLSDATGRWSPLQQIYGHAFAAVRGTAGTLATAATARNDQHLEIVGFNDSPSPCWWWAAYFAALQAASLRADPARPVQYLAGAGLLAPPIQSRFPLTVRNSTLLYGGVTTWTVQAGQVTIENAITTYVTNAQGSPDNSYLEIETMFNLVYVIRTLRAVVQAKYSRVKLAADGTRLAPNSNVVTPAIIKADIIAAYIALEIAGFVQQSQVFGQNLIVEKDATNPNRVNVLWPGVLVNQLRVFATLIQFRLQ